MSVTVLDREMHTEAAAAWLLGVAQGTLNYWLEGGERRGRAYRPMIRVEPRGDRAAVTWADFIEAGVTWPNPVAAACRTGILQSHVADW